MRRASSKKIFISHSASESLTALALSKALSRHGLHAWAWADEGLKHGDQFARTIEQALRAAGWYVVLVSEDALDSPNVNFEIGAAMGGQKRVIPVFLSKDARKKAHAPLKEFVGILAEGLSPGDIAEKVAEAIHAEAA